MPDAKSIARRNARVYEGLNTPDVPRIQPTAQHRTLVSDSNRDLGAGYPFLASLASSDSVAYHAINSAEVPVAATDGMAIYFNAGPGGWLDPNAYDSDERVFIHAHEITHIMREDPYQMAVWRMQGHVAVPRLDPRDRVGFRGEIPARLPFDPRVANKALDAIINAGLIADRVGKCPPDAVVHPRIGSATVDGLAYWIMWQEMHGKGCQGDADDPGQPGQKPGKPSGRQPGSSQGDVMLPGSMGDPHGDQQGSARQDAAEAMRRLAQTRAEREVAVSRAASIAREAGSASSCMEQMIKRCREPGVDWRSYFQGWIARAAGNSAYDWRIGWKPAADRGLVGQMGYFAPARGGHGLGCMIYAGDVSGSIQPDEHRAALAALCEMAHELRPLAVLVLWVDTRILRADLFDGAPDAWELDSYYQRNPVPKGGGTRFHPPFELVDAMAAFDRERIAALLGSRTDPIVVEQAAMIGVPDGLVYVTDLHGPAPVAAPPLTRVLWVATTSQPHPWGERVDLDVASLVRA